MHYTGVDVTLEDGVADGGSDTSDDEFDDERCAPVQIYFSLRLTLLTHLACFTRASLAPSLATAGRY